MKTKLIAVLLLLPFLSMGQQYKLITATESNITIDIQTPAFQAHAVTTPTGEAFVIQAPKAMNRAEAGCPDLPMFVIPTIIGDNALMQVEVVSSEYTDYEGMEIAPSKGDFPRTVNPDNVPYVYGETYRQDAFFPTQLAQLDAPYIHRDVRGQNILIHPYTYNPITKVLRVYTHLVVSMTQVGQDDRNVIARRAKSFVLDPEFKAIYENRYINYKESMAKYTPIEDNGELLIICHDAFMTAMEPFVAWKKQIGRPTTMVGTSTAGTNATTIKAYIANYYAAHPNLTDILLVGDVAQIPGVYISAGSGSSGYSGYGDMQYGQTAGNDYYNELIVGRFCCETEAQVTNHVNKVLNYERDLDATATWLTTGQGISTTSQGGHYGESDYQHIDNIRTDLLGYNYTNVYRDYQNVTGTTATNAAAVSAHINEGVSIINYCNHGNITLWGVFSYSNSHVNALVNDYKLPYIISVACLNGKYDHTSDCFAEAWMRATNNSNGNPTGAIGGMFSYISQPWTPPQYGQDEMVDILVESYANNIRRTMGGVSINGNMKVLDQGATQNAVKGTYNTWILFGDPTLTLRNAVPADMGVNHNSTLGTTATTFVVNAADGDGAIATLTRNGEIMGSATLNNGSATIEFSAPGTTGPATLTVFGYNKITYIATVNITSGGSTTPNPPTNVAATVNQQNVTLTWTAANPADGYKVYRDNTMIAQGITATTYTDSNLDPGTYSYEVSTVYQGMESSRSATVSATIYAPLGVTVTTSDPIYVPNPAPGGGSNITLTAQAVGGNGTYTYQWTPANAVANPRAQTTAASPTQTTTYTCTVTSNGQSVSGSVTVIVVVPPTEVNAEISDDDQVIITWSQAAHADFYNVYRGDLLIAENLTGLTYTDDYRTAGEICYEIRANYQDYLSQQSDPACVFFCVAPEDVTAEYVWNDGNFLVRLTWVKNAAVDYVVDRFRVFRSQDGYNYELLGEVESLDYVYEYHFEDTTAMIGSYQYQISATYHYYECEMYSEPVVCEVTSVHELPDGQVSIKRVIVYNTLGQTILSKEVHNNEIDLDLNSLDRGMYLIQMISDQGPIVKKINVLK